MVAKIGPKEMQLRAVTEARAAEKPKPKKKEKAKAALAAAEDRTQVGPAALEPQALEQPAPEIETANAGGASEAGAAGPAPQQESDVSTTTAAKTTKTKAKPVKGKSSAKKSAAKTKKSAAKAKKSGKPSTKTEATANARSGVISAQSVIEFLKRKEGASMEELEKRFGINAHHMHGKFYYIRNTLKTPINAKEGRFYA